MKPLNYYMSEVEVPEHLDLEHNLTLSRDHDNGKACRDLVRDLLDAIGTGWFRSHSTSQCDRWIAIQSPDTWRRLIRWLAMEVI